MTLLVWIKYHWLVRVAALLTATVSIASSATLDPKESTSSFILFPKLRCLLAFQRSGIALGNFDDYPIYFRNNSVMQLAQTGVYQGASDIEEYVKFAYEGYSPYLANVSNPTSRRNIINKVLGYRNGQCEFLSIYKSKTILNSTFTNDIPVFSYVSMVKIFFDYELGYASRINVYYTADFLRVFFNVGLNSNNARRFLCKDVMSGPCSQILNQTTDVAIKNCEATLQALPVAEGSLNYVDGNTFGCRALHGAFAQKNMIHCPHLSFAPLVDSKGRIKCQESMSASPSELFSKSDFQAFRTFARRRGIDPDIGHDSDL